MKSFKLDISDYNEIKDLSIVSIMNRYGADTLSDDIKLLIQYFNDEYVWEDMFDFNHVQTRISKGHHLFLLYYGEDVIGYVFFEPNDLNEFYLYNLYVTNKVKRPEHSAVWFVNKSIKLLPNSVLKIKCICEDWNYAAQNVFKSNKFKEI
jgi:hypothetical protein